MHCSWRFVFYLAAFAAGLGSLLDVSLLFVEGFFCGVNGGAKLITLLKLFMCILVVLFVYVIIVVAFCSSVRLYSAK